ncbi:MAG: D-2-hydroxyacid dehydrogenase [Akkermansiaceae bacterium]|nr:D-2-hydroxyacid dehydrogenase [Akkermansiaceae bacterium]
MASLKIYSDTPFGDSALSLLRKGIGDHELVLPQKMAQSVLGQSEAGPEIRSVDLIFGQPEVSSVLEVEKLRWMHVSTAGYTRYDNAEFREEMKKRGVVVTNSSSVYANACVEHFMAFLFAQSRQLLPNLASTCANGSEEWFGLRESALPLAGQKLLILGYGTIAQRTVECLKPYKMQISALRRSPRGDEPVPIVTPDTLGPAIAEADHVLNILPDNDQSHHFVNEELLAKMKPGVVFYNIGRGRTVEQSALAAALQSGQIAAAWLDVTDPEPLPEDHELRKAPNCHITPHTAGGHRAESETLVRHFLANLGRFEANEPLLDRII